MTADPSPPPLAAMRGRLAAVPRPPRVDMPAPIPENPAASSPSEIPDPEAGHGHDGAEVDAATGTPTAAPAPVDAPSPTQEASAGEEPDPALVLLAMAEQKGFQRAVRDLYDDQGWDDDLNMTWALPRAVRDTVARFGADQGLANKRAATTVLYLGLLHLGLEIRPNTPEEARATRRRT